MLIYVHGFNSSAQSFKARLLAARLAELGRADEFLSPSLPHAPAEAMARLRSYVEAHRTQRPVLIGSSLGGYYATSLVEEYGLRAVLVNPAVRPYELLRGYVGLQTNLYTGEQYELTEQHLLELRALEVAHVTSERYLLLVQTGDEVLDYREAVAKYAGCRQVVVDGGDHGFREFGHYLDRVMSYYDAG
jgi:uncharacterized protein